MSPDQVSRPAATSSRRSRRALMVLLAGLLVTGTLVILLSSIASNRDTPMRDGALTAPFPRPEETAPPAAVRTIHQALHALGMICKTNDATMKAARARPPVALILDFARRYPDVSFAVDGEPGTTVSLLIVAREALRACAPTLMAEVNQTLPPQYQSPTATD